MARKKNFGSGQLIFENWYRGPVDFFLEPQPKFSKSNECQHVEMDADAEVATWGDRIETLFRKPQLAVTEA